MLFASSRESHRKGMEARKEHKLFKDETSSLAGLKDSGNRSNYRNRLWLVVY